MDDDENISPSNAFRGLNCFAHATAISLATCGLSVSFILKRLDDLIKGFCTTLSMILSRRVELCVALMDSATQNEAVPMRI